MSAASPTEPSRRGVQGTGVRLSRSPEGTVLTVEVKVDEALEPKAEKFVHAVGTLVTRVVDQQDGGAYDAVTNWIETLARTVSVTEDRWNELIGPFYDTSGLERWLGVSRQRLHQRVRSGDLLAVKARNGSLYYPAWQFRGDGAVVRGVPEVVRALRERSPFNVALWLRSRRPTFGDRTAIDVLANGDPDDVATVIGDARADGAAWGR